MARADPGIAERLALHGNELPAIRALAKRQLQHAVRPRAPDLTRRPDRTKAVDADAARPNRNLPNPDVLIDDAGRGLRNEPLVDLRMRIDHQLGARGEQGLPSGLHGHVELRR